MDIKLKEFRLKKLAKTIVSHVDPAQIVELMEKQYPDVNKKSIRHYYRDIDEVAKFYSLLLPIEEPELERLSTLCFFGVYLNIFDDLIEQGANHGTKLLEVIDGKRKASPDIDCEIFYVKVIRNIIESMDEHFRQKIVSIIRGMIEGMIAEHSKDVMTMDEYLSFRSSTTGHDFVIFGIDYGLNVILESELRDSLLMKELRKNTDFFLSVVQDLYSYEKEVDQTKDNSIVNSFVTLKMTKLAIGLDECVDQIIAELDETETKIEENLNKLLVSKPGITDLYFNAYSNALIFFVNYHKKAKRYNLK